MSDIQTKYYAGYFGSGIPSLSKIDFEPRPIVGSFRNMYRIKCVVVHYYGLIDKHKIEGTHIPQSDFEQNTFDTFEEAREHLIGNFRSEVIRLKEEIGDLDAEIAVLQDIDIIGTEAL